MDMDITSKDIKRISDIAMMQSGIYMKSDPAGDIKYLQVKDINPGSKPDYSRITTVVDFFDAVTMDRVYRPAFTVEQALEMLSAERGKAFDPHVVDVFLAHAHEINDLRCKITRECPSFDALIDSL